jgi:NAD+ kinase
MHILIVCNKSNAGAVSAAQELTLHLAQQGISYSVADAFDLPRQPGVPVDGEDDTYGLEYPTGDGFRVISLVVVLGGDGTVLRAARMVGTSGVPIVGINFGHLGFLSNPGDEGVVRVVDAALSGDVVRENRSNLHIDAGYLPHDHLREGLGIHHYASYFALNELAITRGDLGSMVKLSVSVNGDPFMNIRGDGVVLASATGSTAYALSAGGPVVSPVHRGMVMVPLAPHSLHSRAAVTGYNEVVTIELSHDDGTRAASHFIDGQLLNRGAIMNHFTIREGEKPTTLLRYKYDGFYSYAAKTFL